MSLLQALFLGICHVFADPDEHGLGTERVGGGSCVGHATAPPPPEGLKVALGSLLGPLATLAPAGEAGAESRAFAASAVDLLG